MTVDVVSTIIYSATTGAIILAIFSSVHRPHSQHSRNVFLIGLLVLLLLHTLGQLLIASGGYQFAPQLVGLEAPLRMLMGPALYLYSRSMMSNEKFRIWRNFVLAMLGPILIMLIMLPYFQLTSEQKLALSNPATSDPDLFRLVLIICGATSVVFVGVTFAYLAAALRLQARHRQRVMEQYANIETRALDWLRGMLVVWGCVWLLYIVNNALWLFDVRPQGLGESLVIFNALAVIAFAHLGLNQSYPILDAALRIDSVTDKPPVREARAAPDREPSLAIERMERIASKLKQAMEHNRLFADNDLSLRRLADVTKTSTNHLSETFSQHLKTNFFKFVNEYRIAEAKKLLAISDSTITTIAYEVGYNSRSTFNSAFKTETGLTPTSYRNQLKGPSGS